MSYNKNTWQTGDVITAEKLNHLEGGIEEADKKVFIVHFYRDQDEFRFLEDFEDIENAFYPEDEMVPLIIGVFDDEILPLCTSPGFYYSFQSFYVPQPIDDADPCGIIIGFNIDPDPPHLVTQFQYSVPVTVPTI